MLSLVNLVDRAMGRLGNDSDLDRCSLAEVAGLRQFTYFLYHRLSNLREGLH